MNFECLNNENKEKTSAKIRNIDLVRILSKSQITAMFYESCSE